MWLQQIRSSDLSIQSNMESEDPESTLKIGSSKRSPDTELDICWVSTRVSHTKSSDKDWIRYDIGSADSELRQRIWFWVEQTGSLG